MNTSIHIAETPAEVAKDFATYLIQQISENEKYFVALSGGSTPKILFELLATEYADVPWSNVFFFWGDERCVSPEDNQSNYKMANDLFFSKINIPAENIHRIHGESDPVLEAKRYEEVLKKTLPLEEGQPTFDMVILGMGDDGHTASIFPHQIELLEATTLTAVAMHPTSGQKRITLTGNTINQAKQVAFLVTGAGKKEILIEIIRKSGNAESYPASYIQPLSGNLHWFTDIEVT